MLPPYLKTLHDNLVSLGFSARSTDQDKILAELQKIDAALDETLGSDGLTALEASRTKAAFSKGLDYMGPAPGKCPYCNR